MSRVRRWTENIKHGTNSGYTYGCRCVECKQAHNDEMKLRLKVQRALVRRHIDEFHQMMAEARAGLVKGCGCLVSCDCEHCA